MITRCTIVFCFLAAHFLAFSQTDQKLRFDSLTFHFYDRQVEVNSIEYGQKVLAVIHRLAGYELVDGNYKFNVKVLIEDLDGNLIEENDVQENAFRFTEQDDIEITSLLYSPLEPGKEYRYKIELLDRYSNQKIAPVKTIKIDIPTKGKTTQLFSKGSAEWMYPKIYRNKLPYNGNRFYQDEVLQLEMMFNNMVLNDKKLAYEFKIQQNKKTIVSQADTVQPSGFSNYFQYTYDFAKNPIPPGNYTATFDFKGIDNAFGTMKMAYEFEIVDTPKFNENPVNALSYDEMVYLMEGDTVVGRALVEGHQIKAFIRDLEGLQIDNGMVALRLWVRLLADNGVEVWNPGEHIDLLLSSDVELDLNVWMNFTIPPHIQRADSYQLEFLVADKNSPKWMAIQQKVEVENYFKNRFSNVLKEKALKADMLCVKYQHLLTEGNTFPIGNSFDVKAYYTKETPIESNEVVLYAVQVLNSEGSEMLDFKTEIKLDDNVHDVATSEIETGSNWPAGTYRLITKLYTVSGSHHFEYEYIFKLE